MSGILYYTQPANDWNEALPIGNGRMGARSSEIRFMSGAS